MLQPDDEAFDVVEAVVQDGDVSLIRQRLCYDGAASQVMIAWSIREQKGNAGR